MTLETMRTRSLKKTLGILILVTAAITPVAVYAANATASAQSAGIENFYFGKFVGAGLALGLAALGAGVGIGQAGAAAIAGSIEKPQIRTFALLIVALAEALAIYGFALAFIILGTALPA